ncbi:MAG: hypothetical protein J6Z36_00745 [Clostridia bacterium]|nr:hypothetical protein [Clostridia bacterium]
MSVIVAFKHNNIVYMGADTIRSFDGFKIRLEEEANMKIKKYPNDILVGFTGGVRTAQRIRGNEALFTIPNGALTKEYLVKNTVPALLQFLETQDLIKTDEEEGEKEMDCDMVIAANGKLFEVFRDFSVTEVNRFIAIGSGNLYTIPYLSAIDTEKDIKAQLIDALRSAEKYDEGVGSPFALIDSESLKFEIRED